MEDWWTKMKIRLLDEEDADRWMSPEALYLSFKSRLIQELSEAGLQIVPIQEPEKKKRANNRFQKPTLTDIENYIQFRINQGHPKINARAFYDFYEAKCWMIGKNKMKDWQASVRTWENRVEKKEDLSTKRTHASQKLWRPE